jgi:hypothetical protein
MPQNERVRVWKGELKRTSGGLRKQDLMKNTRGKIVSKKKSEAAKKNAENNLGQWLRSKGEQFLSKGLKKENIVRKGKPGRKPFNNKKEDPKKKVVPKSGTVPKLEKLEPMKAGEKKDLSKVSVGNIVVGRPKRVRKKRVLYNAS